MYTSLKCSTFQWSLFGQALTANIQQGWKFLAGSNTLAYFVRATALMQKSIIKLRLGQSPDFRTFLNYFELMEKFWAESWTQSNWEISENQMIDQVVTF